MTELSGVSRTEPRSAGSVQPVRRQLADTTHKVLALAQRFPGLVVLPAHNPTAARRLLAS
jgi:hypothetical protein